MPSSVFLAIVLSCSFFWGKFLCLLTLSSLCAYFSSAIGKSAMSPGFQDIGLMKKRSSSAQTCRASCSPGTGTLGVVSNLFCICSDILSWLLYLLGHSSTEALLACYGQCLVPGVHVVHFN